jgi:hypothetical protein
VALLLKFNIVKIMGGVDTPLFVSPFWGAVPRGREGFRPIRIKPRANHIASMQKPEISGIRAQARFHSLAFYTESETALGVLCGSA